MPLTRAESLAAAVSGAGDDGSENLVDAAASSDSQDEHEREVGDPNMDAAPANAQQHGTDAMDIIQIARLTENL